MDTNDRFDGAKGREEGADVVFCEVVFDTEEKVSIEMKDLGGKCYPIRKREVMVGSCGGMTS